MVLSRSPVAAWATPASVPMSSIATAILSNPATILPLILAPIEARS
jgi:hypothetical protein